MGKRTLGAVDARGYFDAGWDAAIAYYVKTLPENVLLMRPKVKECCNFGGPCVGRGLCAQMVEAGTRVGFAEDAPRPFPAVGPGPYQGVPNLASERQELDA